MIDTPGGAAEIHPDYQSAATPPQLSAKHADALRRWLTRRQVPDDIRQAALAQLQNAPDAATLVGECGNRVFVIVVQSLPEGDGRQRTIPGMLHLTRAIAVQELVLSKAVVSHFVALGLSNSPALRKALTLSSSEVQVAGRIQGMEQQAAVEGDFAVAFVVADEVAVFANLLQPARISALRVAYRDVVQEQMRGLMHRGGWQKALVQSEHLFSCGLVSPGLFLDTARCYVKLEKSGNAQRILRQMLTQFGAAADAGSLEEAGDIAKGISGQTAEQLAVRAYTMASERLLYQLTP
jgi:hypothetical protein